MFKVVLIDDEPLIVRSIKNLIEMVDEEFRVEGTAHDGYTALSMVEEVKPDVMFVDISMPVMDGFEFLEKARERGCTVPAVILSGYQEFGYAKKAIRLSVLDYLVKPINPMMLADFLTELKGKLKKNRYGQQKEYLEDCLRGNKKTLAEQGVFDENSDFCMVKICYGPYNFFRNNQFSIGMHNTGKQKLTEICEEVLKEEDVWWILDGKEENESFLLVQTRRRGIFMSVQEAYHEILKRLFPGECITFAVSKEMVSLEKLCEEKVTLESALYYQSIFGMSQYLQASDSIKKEERKKIDIMTFRTYLESRNEKELLGLLKSTLDICRDEVYTQAEVIQILKDIMNTCCQSTSEYEMYFMINLVLSGSRDYKELYRKFSETLLEYSGLNDKEEERETSEYVVNKICQYLDEQFRSKIRIQDVADLFGFNYSYLCHLFRKQIGVSPNEYIIMKRIELAKKLLEQPGDLSVKEIAAMVGYQDPYYFSRIFKAYEEVSPSDYKKEGQGSSSNFR